MYIFPLKNLKPGSTWHHSHQILLHTMFIAGYEYLPDQLNLWKQFLKQANMFYKATSVISPFQDYFECSSLLINTNKTTVFIGFRKLEDTLQYSG